MVSSIEKQMYFLFLRDTYVLRPLLYVNSVRKTLFSIIIHLQIESVKYQLTLDH